MTPIERELERIRLADPEGVLRPHAVVEFARDPQSPLHRRFIWDDTEAARQFRLHQARQIISVRVTRPNDSSPPVRVYVSLDEDRYGATGYRRTSEVLRDDAMRESLLAQARRDMRTFAAKYRALAELAGVIEAIEDTQHAVA